MKLYIRSSSIQGMLSESPYGQDTQRVYIRVNSDANLEAVKDRIYKCPGDFQFQVDFGDGTYLLYVNKYEVDGVVDSIRDALSDLTDDVDISFDGFQSEFDDYSESSFNDSDEIDETYYYVIPKVLKGTKNNKSYVLYYPGEYVPRTEPRTNYTFISKHYVIIHDGNTYIEKDYLDSIARDEGRSFRKFVSSLRTVIL